MSHLIKVGEKSINELVIRSQVRPSIFSYFNGGATNSTGEFGYKKRCRESISVRGIGFKSRTSSKSLGHGAQVEVKELQIQIMSRSTIQAQPGGLPNLKRWSRSGLESCQPGQSVTGALSPRRLIVVNHLEGSIT